MESDTQKHFANKNGSNAISILYTGSHKSFPVLYGLWGGGEFLKRTLTYLYCTKCNEINMSIRYT